DTLVNAFEYAKSNGKCVHFIGLVSKGGVHSSQNHLYALCEMANSFGLTNVFVHAFTDGRDCDPISGQHFIAEMEEELAKRTGKIASIVGRYYVMDRDNRWERIKKAYDLLVHGEGTKYESAKQAIKHSYLNDITDEFIEPSVNTDEAGNPLTTIQDGDVVINFNYRTDRPREISIALTQEAFPEHQMSPLQLHYVTMTNY